MNVPFDNPHAKTIAALLRHTVNNPAASTLPLDYAAWQRINSVLWSKPLAIGPSQAEQLTQDFCALLASITQHTRLAYSQSDLTWLIGVIDNRDVTTLALLLAMATMEPIGDRVSTEVAAEMFGHARTALVRRWCNDGRFLSAEKVDERTWTLSRSEIRAMRDVS